MENRFDSCCGFYCGACDIFLDDEADSVNYLAESRGTSPEELWYQVCRSQVLDCTIR